MRAEAEMCLFIRLRKNSLEPIPAELFWTPLPTRGNAHR
jgi:hypothetical protein